MASIPLISLTILASFCSCEAFKILLMFPFPGKSHGILGDGYVRHLLEAGHEVTYITPFPKKDPHPNLRQVDVSLNMKHMEGIEISIEAILNKEVDMNDISALMPMVLGVTRSTIENPNVQKLINDPNVNFDVIIIEWLFSEVASGLSAVFDCPYIWSSSVEPHWIVLELIDEQLSPAYNSDIMSSTLPPYTFKERVMELTSQIIVSIVRAFVFYPKEKKQYEEAFGPSLAKRGKVLPPYDSVKFNASFMLGNSHVSLGQATRLPQNYKSIAGYHIDPEVKPLPEDLKKIIENAKNGVIYFSMGSNLKSKDMPEKLKRSLIQMFGGLKYTVLWKFEQDFPNLPKNIHILKWAPQQSILAHPNCVLFITHGGLLSTTETVHFGVPIIGVPVFADQFLNVDRAVRKGFAKRVDLSHTMAEELKLAIEDILGNTKYVEKVKELSLIYHDRPVAPGAELVHWVEHVVRTRGAPHLRSPALLVPWYQKMYLDLAALILTVIIVLKMALRRIFCSKKVDNKKKNN